MEGMSMKFLCIMVVFMVVAAPYAEAVTCDNVVSKLSPCLNYLKDGGKVPAACCSSVRALNGAARSTSDKKTTCNCLKNAAKPFSGNIKTDNALGLPKKCGVNIPYKISMSTDCNSIK
ncbi:hypothetical protein L1987_12955 [Smallanthus sonchifolius]|uniref:Uncharacterized protein n=1 Tax=Smallanthus sonchifolius TaxID=185202 RepID=A0ACB9JHD4_9ASTR|nr:hypothetical protein L1987_12955 [Smallanthus sonchifolius]